MILTFMQEPKEQAYLNLINLASTICSQFILVKRHQMSFDKNAKRVLQELSPYLEEEDEQNSWPGTRFAPTSTVYYYLLNDDSKAILKKYATGLYSWVQPNLPEDLSFLKGNGEEWLANTAHELQSYIKSNNPIELEKVKAIKGLVIREG